MLIPKNGLQTRRSTRILLVFPWCVALRVQVVGSLTLVLHNIIRGAVHMFIRRLSYFVPGVDRRRHQGWPPVLRYVL